MGVFVLGMHRSGTSALAGALEAMGFAVGPEHDVMPADIDNPEGYFELLSVVRANDELLAHYGGRWDSPPVLPTGWKDDDTAAAFVSATRVMLDEYFESNHFVLKDPRISILLPVWREVTRDKGCAVVIVRDPQEVAASLNRRNGLLTQTGVALWAAYNRAILHDLRGMRVHLCSYADLIVNPVEVLGDIANSLQTWREVPDDLDLTRAFAAVHPEHRRNSVASSDFEDGALPVEIGELMKLVLDQRGRHDSFDLGTNLVSGWWEGALLDERRLLLRWAHSEIAERETHNSQLLTENALLWQQRDAAMREADYLRERLEYLGERLERARRFVPAPLRRIVNKFDH